MKVSFLALSPEAKTQAKHFKKAFGTTSEKKADIIVVLGGDGFMLQCLHKYIDKKYQAKIYGMNMGTVGFLMNKLSTSPAALEKKLVKAKLAELHPLRLKAQTKNKKTKELLAINEVALLRQSSQTAHIRISVDGKRRLDPLYADGVLLATAAGSTAYNLSVGGPIVPINADLLALTPISAFRPRHWRGALLPASAKVRFDILDNDKRAISATADQEEIRDVVRVEVVEDKSITLPLLFDEGHELEERIISEQFQS